MPEWPCGSFHVLIRVTPTMGPDVGLGQRIRVEVLVLLAFNCLLLFLRGVQQSRFHHAPICNSDSGQYDRHADHQCLAGPLLPH